MLGAAMPRISRVFVTGATGFVGRSVVQALRAEGHAVRCLVRRGSEHNLRGLEAIERVQGYVLAPKTLEDGIAGCDAVVHLVGIIREDPARGVTFERVHVQGTLNVLSAAADAGVRRVVHMSALGTRAAARSRYHQTKWAAEEAVRGSALPWTIFRPSIIYGRGDGFISMLAAMIKRYPAVPVIGDGRQRLQPIPVEQIATAFARAVTLSETVKQTYEVGGPDAVTMVDLLDVIAKTIGKRRLLKIPVPLAVISPLARVLHRLPSFPVTPDQLLMLGEDSVCDPTPFVSTFALKPIPLAVGLDRMLG
jgi:NADH dehydrogenase